ncbi:uncharacterized protein LOC125235317 [Leguminivora glycinivorella]|uniref:uncharacterized protein LOC125235317 n=1 Tax=Leguminivora glycinivorella TaxID=1035111 RepID=UPI0020105986|nr:uncharacterized protein LOC125235317 [Leguminivora glycinivorella]
MLDRSAIMRHAKCCCVPVETATFIFAVFSSVISGFATVAAATANTWLGAVTGDENFQQIWDDPESIRQSMGDRVYNQRFADYSAALAAMMFFFTCSVVSFIFSVFLCYGTHRRRPGFVKAYLVYGVVVTILMMTGAVLYSWAAEEIIVGSMILIGCGVYSIILLMVQRTYETLRVEQSRNSGQLLCPEPEPCMKS